MFAHRREAWLFVGITWWIAAACGSSERTPQASAGHAGVAGNGVAGAAVSSAGHAGSSGLGGRAGEATGGKSTAGERTEPVAGERGEAGGAAGVGGVASGGSPSDAGAAGACEQPCARQASSAFCEQDEVTWLCEADFDATLFNAQCRDAATALTRFCCPPEFRGQCAAAP